MKKSNTSKRYSSRNKLELVIRMVSGSIGVNDLSRETGISSHSLIDWKELFFTKGHLAFDKPSREKQTEKNKLIDKQKLEIQLLKKLLEHYKTTQNCQYSRSPDST